MLKIPKNIFKFPSTTIFQTETKIETWLYLEDVLLTTDYEYLFPDCEIKTDWVMGVLRFNLLSDLMTSSMT